MVEGGRESGLAAVELDALQRLAIGSAREAALAAGIAGSAGSAGSAGAAEWVGLAVVGRRGQVRLESGIKRGETDVVAVCEATIDESVGSWPGRTGGRDASALRLLLCVCHCMLV